MSDVKGAFTQIAVVDGKVKIIARKVMYNDGEMAFLCALPGFGEADKRDGKETAYAFTWDSDKALIYLSEGYRNEVHKSVVRAATLTSTGAGKIIHDGIKLKWLTEAEMLSVEGNYLKQKAEIDTAAVAEVDNGPVDVVKLEKDLNKATEDNGLILKTEAEIKELAQNCKDSGLIMYPNVTNLECVVAGSEEVRYRCPKCDRLIKKGRKSHICPHDGTEAIPDTKPQLPKIS
jgi:hypothetical protein